MINLIPPIEKAKIAGAYKKRFFIVFLSLSATAFLIGAVFLVSPYRLAEDNTATILKNIDIVKSLNGPLETSNPEFAIKDIQKKLGILASQKNKNTAGVLIENILSEQPRKVGINGFTYGKKKGDSEIEIRGTADSRDDMLDFVRTLENNQYFAKVDVPVSVFIKDKNLEFSIQVTTKTPTP
ncbi:MAG: PilN domain-containing protein [Patescibacteria group bacterium]